MAQETEEEIQFVDAEEYNPTPKGAVSYEQIVLEQIKRCVIEGSKEMSGGYFKQKQTSQGTQEVYIPDQKQVYIQCVKSLYDVLLPHFDDEMKAKDAEFDLELETMKENKINSLREQLKTVKDARQIQNINFQIATGYIDENSLQAKQISDERIEVYRWLYQQLIYLYSRVRYLLPQSISDG